MMQSLLAVPSPHEDSWVVNLADWVELRALFNADGNTSREDLNKALRRDGDLTEARGLTNDAIVEEKITHVFKELKDREKSCGQTSAGRFRYPFEISRDQSLLTIRNTRILADHLIYLFLLAVTKSDMSSQRAKTPHDPTKVFERLCRDVVEAFWGGASATSGAILFGTSKNRSNVVQRFRSNIEDLCNKLGEGLGWRDDAIAPGGGDGGLDVVAFRRFSDARQGGLVGFGQCKTGIHWEDSLTHLTPRTFSSDYMAKGLAIDPLRMYLVPCRISDHNWGSHTGKAGLLMDRCRIVEYSQRVSPDVSTACRSWLEATLAAQKSRNRKRKRVRG